MRDLEGRKEAKIRLVVPCWIVVDVRRKVDETVMANIVSSTEVLGARLLREVQSEEGGLEAVSSNHVDEKVLVVDHVILVFLRPHLI